MSTLLKRGFNLTMVLCATAVSTAQTNCPPPPGRGNTSVVAGNHYYYTIDTTGIPAGADGTNPSAAITTAIQAWNTALAGPATTDFQPAGAGTPVDIIIYANVGASTLAGSTQTTLNSLIDSNTPATITIYPNARFSDGTPFLNSQAPNYKNALTAIVLHEFAHVLGACDYDGTSGCPFVPDPWPGPSVLNFFHGTNNGQTVPPVIAPTACDVGNAVSYSHFTPGTGGGTPGSHLHTTDPPPGASGGTSGCAGGSYFDSDTNTVYGWC